MKTAHLIFFILTIQFLTFSQRITPEDYLGWERHNGLAPIRINYIIIQRDDSTGNFSDSDSTQHFFKQVTGNINYIYSALKNTQDLACYRGKLPFNPALNVRFEFTLIFIQNSKLWDNKGVKYGYFCPEEKNWWLKSLDEEITSNPNATRGINIYLTEDGAHYNRLFEDQIDSTFNASRGACSEFPNQKDWRKSSRLHYPNEYSSYLHGYNKSGSDSIWTEKLKWKEWGFAKGLAHELGHSIGLGHNNEHHGRNQCWHSIMHQAGDSPRDYLQPSEIAKINYNLNHTNLTSFIDSNYFEKSNFNVDSTIYINKKTRLYQSIEIKESSQFIVSDTLLLPNSAFVLIRKKGELIFKNQGIILHLDRSKVLIKKGKKTITPNLDSGQYIIEKKTSCWLKKRESVN